MVGFSAFLTTTMPMFKANMNALEKAGIRDTVIVMVGGAPVTQEYADAVGADGYAADASRRSSGPRPCCTRSAARCPHDATAQPLETVLRSATKEVVIGHGRRFCLIGERINPTGRRIFQEQLRAGDLSAIERDVRPRSRAAPTCSTSTWACRSPTRPSCWREAITHGAGAHRPADLHRLLGRRGARGRAVGLPGPGAGQLDHRRGRPDGGDPPAGQEVRRRDHRAAQRPRRDPDGGREADPADRRRSSTSPPRSTASPRPTS